MSYEDVINIINAHYGWSMDAHEPEYKGEIKEKMQAMKQLVSELSVKAEAFDEIKVYMQSAEDKLCDEEYFNEDVYEEYYGIIETVIGHHSENESGESE